MMADGYTRTTGKMLLGFVQTVMGTLNGVPKRGAGRGPQYQQEGPNGPGKAYLREYSPLPPSPLPPLSAL